MFIRLYKEFKAIDEKLALKMVVLPPLIFHLHVFYKRKEVLLGIGPYVKRKYVHAQLLHGVKWC
jgi:hypothetical protein